MKNRSILAILFVIFASLSISAYAKKKCCDFRDNQCFEVVKRCTPGAVEISATIPSVIKIGYAYVGDAPVYIRINPDCPDNTALKIIAQPKGLKNDDLILYKEQIIDYTCGSVVPSRIVFDMANGTKSFFYYEYPKDCPRADCFGKKGSR